MVPKNSGTTKLSAPYFYMRFRFVPMGIANWYKREGFARPMHATGALMTAAFYHGLGPRSSTHGCAQEFRFKRGRDDANVAPTHLGIAGTTRDQQGLFRFGCSEQPLLRAG